MLNPADPFYKELNDGNPAGSTLAIVGEGQESACWGGKYPAYIDHFVVNSAAKPTVVAGSFSQVLFDDEHIKFQDRLSDHCPISVALGSSGAK